jgi:hypothetical protein
LLAERVTRQHGLARARYSWLVLDSPPFTHSEVLPRVRRSLTANLRAIRKRGVK